LLPKKSDVAGEDLEARNVLDLLREKSDKRTGS
jgi:hypothetical protein